MSNAFFATSLSFRFHHDSPENTVQHARFLTPLLCFVQACCVSFPRSSGCICESRLFPLQTTLSGRPEPCLPNIFQLSLATPHWLGARKETTPISTTSWMLPPQLKAHQWQTGKILRGKISAIGHGEDEVDRTHLSASDQHQLLQTASRPPASSPRHRKQHLGEVDEGGVEEAAQIMTG